MRIVALLVVLPILARADARHDAESTAVESIGSHLKHDTGAPSFVFDLDNTLVDHDTSGNEGGHGAEYPIVANDPVTAFSADNTVAWIATGLDSLPYECPTAKKCKADASYRATIVVEANKTRWSPIVWHVAKPISDKELAKAVADKATLPTFPRRIGKGAADAVKVFESTLGDPKAFAKTVSARKDVVLFGSDRGERYVGGAAVAAQLAKWNLAFVVHDGVQAGASANGAVAWVAANVDAAPVKQPKSKTPYRLLCVYEKTAAGWQLVQLHFSFAIPYVM